MRFTTRLVIEDHRHGVTELRVQRTKAAAFDMGTVDIVGDRERGVPRYNEFRRRVALKPIQRFADLTDDDAIVRELETVYGGDVERLDLMVGCLAEALDGVENAFAPW